MNRKCWKLLLLSFLMALTLAGCKEKLGDEEAQKQFDEFIQNDFVDTMENDYLTMHIYLEHPEDYGVDPANVNVQIAEKFDETQFEESRSDLEALKDEFDVFDRDQLTGEQQATYDCYHFMLELALKACDEKFDYMGSNFNTMTGDHTQIPTLFADMVLRSEQDVKDLITLVNDVKPYMESELEYTKKQAENGTLVIGIDEVKERCQEIVDAGMEGSTLSSMKAHIDELNIDNGAKKTYKKQLEEAYRTSFLPAYENVIATLSELDESKNHHTGLANMDNGKEYYELLFKEATGTDTSIEEVKKQLEEAGEDALLRAQMIYLKNSKAYDAFLEDSVRTSYTDYASMLVDLEKAIADDFPTVSKLEYQIEPLPADLATGGIAAYFNIPAIDGTTKKQIRVNTTSKEDTDTIDTFTTVAHEGIPGHMYQIAYAYENITSPWRLTCTNFSGYTEGYATYMELYALHYLDVDEDVKDLFEAMTIYEHSLIALVDIGIHYEGWDLKQLQAFFEEYELDKNAATEIYDQILYNPSAFLSYYVGYQEIISMKEEAQEALGGQYSDLGFHTALLKSGQAPFAVVKQNIDAYVETAKK